MKLDKTRQLAARMWLAKHSVDLANDPEQARLHANVARFFGMCKGGSSGDAESVRKAVKKGITKRRRSR
jgi:hypothetical protein